MSEETERTVDGAIENRMTDARNREQWERDNANRLSHYRAAIVEECARVAENNLGRPATIPAAIRALKDKP